MPDAVREAIESDLQLLAPQFAGVSRASRLGQWLDTAAVFEARGLLTATKQLLFALLRLTGYTSDAATVAARALISARIGRAARVAGDLVEASEWYEEARRCAWQLPEESRWLDAAPSALLGLGMVSVGRGNYPRAERQFTAVLREKPLLAPMYLVHAQMALCLVHRKRARFGDALTLSWDVLDQISPEDPRWPEVLVTMAELAGELGIVAGAVKARLAALAVARTPRVASAALGGLLSLLADLPEEERSAAVMLFHQSTWGRYLFGEWNTGADDTLRRLAHQSRRWIDAAQALGLTPHDQVLLLIGSVRLAIRIGLAPEPWTVSYIEKARTLSNVHAFHERQFEVEALHERLVNAQMTAAQSEVTQDGAGFSEVARRDPRNSGSLRMTESLAIERLRGAIFTCQIDERAVFA
ncbi:MAG: hypothetical protein K2R93_06490 [Gemmatimonadaceae bacterium]|nr:hypothetical protein [Gemmatimonadaceae bacterium]